MENMSIGEKIRHLRDVRSMTLAVLAEYSGIPLTTIHYLETHKKADPKISTLAKIAEALRVDIQYFLMPNARTPLQVVGEHLTEGLRQFIVREESMPYLELGEKALEMGLPPEAVESLMNALADAQKSKRK